MGLPASQVQQVILGISVICKKAQHIEDTQGIRDILGQWAEVYEVYAVRKATQIMDIPVPEA